MSTNLKFFYNGIKGSDKKLQKCYYFKCFNCPNTITIRNDSDFHFTKQILDELIVDNNTNPVTSSFEKMHIEIGINHPLHSEVKYAFYQQERKQEKNK